MVVNACMGTGWSPASQTPPSPGRGYDTAASLPQLVEEVFVDKVGGNTLTGNQGPLLLVLACPLPPGPPWAGLSASNSLFPHIKGRTAIVRARQDL